MNNLKIYQLPISKNQKLLLYLLKELGAESEPVALTLDKVAEHAGMARLTVNKQLMELKHLKLITVDVGKGKASNSYRLNLDK